MELSFKKLTPAIADDFLRFFDHDAFSDHEEWDGCYCLESHLTQRQDEALAGKKPERREKAKQLIDEGVMTGYLIYDGDTVVGWCNAGDKTTYRPICEYEGFYTDELEKGKIKILYCIDIAPDHRGKGIANRIIEQFLADAKEEGYSYVEAYPYTDEKFAYQYRGPVKVYEKYGFAIYRKLDWAYVMRKAL